MLAKSMRAASLESGLNGDTISKILRSPSHSQTLETVEKLAKGLETTPAWLAYGIEGTGEASSGAGVLLIDKELLRQALLFVLRNERVPEDRADLIADILPEALSGVLVDAVERDPLLSFQVHYQLEAQRFAHPEPR